MKKIFEWIKEKLNIRSVVRHVDINNEILNTLKSIDKRMSMVEKCIKENKKHGSRHYLITGHWND